MILTMRKPMWQQAYCDSKASVILHTWWNITLHVTVQKWTKVHYAATAGLYIKILPLKSSNAFWSPGIIIPLFSWAVIKHPSFMAGKWESHCFMHCILIMLMWGIFNWDFGRPWERNTISKSRAQPKHSQYSASPSGLLIFMHAGMCRGGGCKLTGAL